MNKEVSVLGKNIKEIRTVKEITRSKLNQLTGIDNLILYEIESGDISTLSPSDLEKIANALDTSTLTLLGENVDIYKHIQELIEHLAHEFKINRDYLTDNERFIIASSLESAIDKIK